MRVEFHWPAGWQTFLRGRDEIVVGAGEAVGAVLGVGVAVVVEDLVFGRGVVDALFGFEAAVEDAAVAFGGDLPVDGELEVGVLVVGDEVAALCRAGEFAIDDGPAVVTSFFW